MPTLYWHPISPPARAVALALAALKVDHDKKVVDLLNGGNKKPEYLQINPQHTVPFLVDGAVKTAESSVIIMYLAEKYGATNPNLYPRNDVELRTKINHRLAFGGSTLFNAFLSCIAPIAFAGQKAAPEEAVAKLKEAVGWLRDFVSPTGYAAGTSHATVADVALLAFYTSIQCTGNFFVNLDDYPELDAWAEKVKKAVPDYEKANGEGVKMFGEIWEKRKPQ